MPAGPVQTPQLRVAVGNAEAGLSCSPVLALWPLPSTFSRGRSCGADVPGLALAETSPSPSAARHPHTERDRAARASVTGAGSTCRRPQGAVFCSKPGACTEHANYMCPMSRVTASMPMGDTRAMPCRGSPAPGWDKRCPGSTPADPGWLLPGKLISKGPGALPLAPGISRGAKARAVHEQGVRVVTTCTSKACLDAGAQRREQAWGCSKRSSGQGQSFVPSALEGGDKGATALTVLTNNPCQQWSSNVSPPCSWVGCGCQRGTHTAVPCSTSSNV